MPPSFEFPIQNDPVELWTTIAGDASGSEPVTGQRGAHFLQVIGASQARRHTGTSAG